MQPDSIIPDLSNPQSWNRYSYVTNSPLRYSDPTGHAQYEDLYEESDGVCDSGDASCNWLSTPNNGNGGNGGSGDDLDDDLQTGSGDCEKDEICLDISLQNDCGGTTCQMFATGVGLLATGLDTGAFFMNLSFAAAADVAFLFGGPKAFLAMVALYRIASPIPNVMGSYGGLMWALQGMVLGDTHLDFSGTFSSDLWRNEAMLSLTLSQDTVVSVINDGLGWIIPEPNLAATSSLAGVLYDIGRNPLSPYLSSAAPIIPNYVAPTYSMSLDLSSPMPISRGWSLFPPYP